MPRFLEDKLFAEYGNNPHAVYGTMNKLGAMRGNKTTAKGERMQRKHDADVKAGTAKPAPAVQASRPSAPAGSASRAAALASHPHAARLGRFLHGKKSR